MSLTLRNQFYSKLGARVKSKTVEGPMATSKCNIVNMIHAMYSLQLQEDIDRILVHRMQHNNKVLSVKNKTRRKKNLFIRSGKLSEYLLIYVENITYFMCAIFY